MFEQENYECSPYDDKCKDLIEKFLTICLPVTITPCVKVKTIKTECCGTAIIVPKHESCCKGKEDDRCEFTIIQKMKIEIPVEFSAETSINDPFVDCEFRKERKDKDEKEHKDYKDDCKQSKEHEDYKDDCKQCKEHEDYKDDCKQYKEHEDYRY